MTSVQADALPMPALVELRGAPVRAQSAAGDFVFTRVPDSQMVPRAWVFTWGGAHGAVGDVIRRHYADHFAAAFSFTLPRTAEVVILRWLSPPSIQWSSAVAIASATGEFEECLAHE